MGEVGFEFVAGEAADMLLDDDALGEGGVDGHLEAAVQLGEADQRQAQALPGVHAEVGQQWNAFHC